MSYPGQIHHPHTPGEPPNARSIGGEGWVPDTLELVQAHWFVRHGERSPVRKRLVGVGAIPAIFPLCAIGREFSTAVLAASPPAAADSAESHSFEGAPNNHRDYQIPTPNGEAAGFVRAKMDVRRLSEDQGTGNSPTVGGKADCFWGELTDLGRQSTLTLGARLRSLYVDQLDFLPSVLPDVPLPESPVTFRSTGMPRTIESLHQIVQGLFPERDGAVLYTVRNPMEESLYPNSLCARMRRLDRASADQAAKTYNPTLASLDPIIGKFVNRPLRIDGHPRANGVLDTIMVCKAHGIVVPKEFEDTTVLETLESAVVHEWFDAYANPEFRKLAMGRLLGDLEASLERKMADPLEKKDKLRLAVYSCHDTSLGGILNALNVFDSRWPPFTSHIAVELFRSAPPPGSPTPSSSFLPSLLHHHHAAPPPPHFVRMKYNGKPVTIPACRKPGMHLAGTDGELCTWEGFKEAVGRVRMTAAEWEGGCE